MPSQEFREKQLSLWEEMITSLFEGNTPLQKVWSDRQEIIEVLDYVGTHKALNHTFLPESGGLDLNGCGISNESQCIEMDLGGVYIIKPKKLTFQWFEEADYEWAYFMLEADTLDVTGVYENLSFKSEELVEIEKGKYISRNHWDSNEYNGRRLPEEARLVERYTSGQFAIFSKASKYNGVSSAYDGRHDKVTPIAFKNYIEEIVNRLNLKK